MQTLRGAGLHSSQSGRHKWRFMHPPRANARGRGRARRRESRQRKVVHTAANPSKVESAMKASDKSGGGLLAPLQAAADLRAVDSLACSIKALRSRTMSGRVANTEAGAVQPEHGGRVHGRAVWRNFGAFARLGGGTTWYDRSCQIQPSLES